MGFHLPSAAIRFCVTVVVLAIILFIFEDALFELVLGAGKEQSTVIESLEILAALVVSFLAVRRAFKIAQHRAFSKT